MPMELTLEAKQRLCQAYLNYLSLVVCQQQACVAFQRGDTPIGALLISNKTVSAWQRSLTANLTKANWQAMQSFLALPEYLRLQVICKLALEGYAISNNSCEQEAWLLLQSYLKKESHSTESIASTQSAESDARLLDSLDLALCRNLFASFSQLDKFELANQREKEQAVFGHCECLILEAAQAKLKTRRFNNFRLYVNLEPCLLCSSAIITAQVGELFYLQTNAKAGAVESQIKLLSLPWLNHHVKFTKLDASVLTNITSLCLCDFFHNLRHVNKQMGQAKKRKALYMEKDKFSLRKEMK